MFAQNHPYLPRAVPIKANGSRGGERDDSFVHDRTNVSLSIIVYRVPARRARVRDEEAAGAGKRESAFVCYRPYSFQCLS
jgi:hypothetical protein